MSKKPEKIDSIRKLAKHVGRSHSVVAEWVKDDRWPFARKAPWPMAMLSKFRAWAAETLAPNPADAIDDLEIPKPHDRADERAAKLKILHERGRTLELQRKQTEGLLVERETVKREWTERLMSFKHQMQALPARLTTLLEGITDAVEQEEIIRAQTRIILNYIAGKNPDPTGDDPFDYDKLVAAETAKASTTNAATTAQP